MAKPTTNRVAWALTAILVGAAPGPGKSSTAQGAQRAIIRCPVKVWWKGKEVRVSLAALQRALRRHYPGWSLPPLAAYDADVRENYERERKPEVPFACCGDFDGNGLPDVALILQKRRSRWLVVAFHQTYRGTFRSYRLDQWRGRGDVDGHVQMTIERMPRGPVTYLTGGPNMATATMRIEHDGIFESNEEGFGMTYYFKGGRHYRSVDTGD